MIKSKDTMKVSLPLRLIVWYKAAGSPVVSVREDEYCMMS